MNPNVKCLHCHRSFTRYLIAPLFVMGEMTLACPICALDALRALHGDDYEFSGEIARQMYEEACAEAVRR